jgi:very-short-patch-repair endonuclease
MPLKHNLPEMKGVRRQLRHSMTNAKKKFWYALDKGQLKGWRLRRQHSVDRYVLDFYCAKAKLAVEFDGSSHNSAEAIEYDAIRTEYLNSIGIKVIRFSNNAVENNLSGVFLEILRNLEGDFSIRD